MTVPVYIDRGNEHPEAREQVGTAEVALVDGERWECQGTIQFDEEHRHLAGLLGSEFDVTMGFGPSGGSMVIRSTN